MLPLVNKDRGHGTLRRVRKQIGPGCGERRGVTLRVCAAGALLLVGCGASASQEVRGALAKGDVRAALVAYERIDAEDRASLAAIARAVLQAALRDPELRVREKALDALAAAGPGAADMLRELARDQGSPALQALSLARLARNGDGSAASTLRARLDDVDDTVRAEATAFLDPKGEATRLRARLADPSPKVRRVAANLLARAPADAETALALTRAARTDPDLGVRRSSLLALGGQGTLATQALIERLADADAEVRMVATSSLFEADPGAAGARFSHELSAEPNAERVEAARHVLGRSRHESRHESLHAAARDQLARALAHHDGALRSQAAVALSALDGDDARALALARAPHEGLRSIRLWLALAAGGGEGKALLRELAKLRDVVAAQSRAELARMDEHGARKSLAALLGCSELPVRLIVVRTLGRELARPHAIRSALLDDALDVRLAAASAVLAAG